MTTNLLRAPGNNPTLRRVVTHTPGMVCLDVGYVTPAVRWFSLADMVAANDKATVAAALRTPERLTVKAVDMGIVFTVPMAPNMTELLYTVEEPEIGCELPPLITLWQPLARNISHMSGTWLRVWGEPVTLWHPELKAG